MIAVDTSSFIAYLSGSEGADVGFVEAALVHRQAVLPPVVLTELTSDPKLPAEVARALKEVPLLALGEGFWERAGTLRAKVLGHGLRARLTDTMIAQACIDHAVPLVTRDTDFRHFVRHGGLILARR